MSAPDYAASIWTVGDKLHMELPGETLTHTVVFPITGRGLAVITQILLERERAEHIHRKVGFAAAPVQYDIDAMLKAFPGTVTVIPSARKVKAQDDLTLEDLGL